MSSLISQREIDFIFRFREDLRIVTRESAKIEFKENFNWNNRYKYAKTLAAFANNQGGTIVFGVKDSPRHAIGLKDDKFESTDEEAMTQYFNSLLAPELIWEKQTVNIGNKIYGLLHVAESKTKPVIAVANAEGIKESDIFYRYNGRSERIKYPELRLIIDNERKKERNLWMQHMQKISRIGIENLATIDISKGVIEGDKQRIYIDENILNQIKFIKEGEFDEKIGAPTLRLLGEVQEMSGTVILPTRTKISGIHTREIAEAMLKGSLHEGTSAQEYIESLPFERSKFMPIYFFLVEGNIAIASAETLIRKSPSTASQLKDGLIERLSQRRSFGISSYDEQTLKSNLLFSNYADFKNYCESNNSDKTIKTAILHNLLMSKYNSAIYDFIENESKTICEMITLLSCDEIIEKRQLIADVILEILDSRLTEVASEFRYALSHIDTTLYYDKCHKIK